MPVTNATHCLTRNHEKREGYYAQQLFTSGSVEEETEVERLKSRRMGKQTSLSAVRQLEMGTMCHMAHEREDLVWESTPRFVQEYPYCYVDLRIGW